MKIAILGRQPEIGIAELESIFGGKNIRVLNKESAIIKTNKINISHFGSILKVGEVLFEINSTNWREVSEKIIKNFIHDFSNYNKKITLGISVYSSKIKTSEIQKTAQIIKNKLKNHGVSVRIIQSKNITLSTATSHNNKLGLSENKIEILITEADGKIIVALSEGSQNITAYAKRDQNRPKRDAFVGMLPPKLAQTMINLAVGENQPQIKILNGERDFKTLEILDPFCGTGTVLQEAILKGFKAHGTDLSEKMINYSKENIEWLMKEFRPHGENGEVFQADATKQKWNFSKNLQSVVCETYLGQPFSAPPSDKKLIEVRENCNRIISNFLKNLSEQIPKNTRICIAIPAWKTQNGNFSHLPLVDFLQELGYNRKEFMRVKSHNLMYYRENQVVARELLVLIKE